MFLALQVIMLKISVERGTASSKQRTLIYNVMVLVTSNDIGCEKYILTIGFNQFFEKIEFFTMHRTFFEEIEHIRYRYRCQYRVFSDQLSRP